MSYCIFLKSLRILEEFRKNLCVKIPPKSPCANFQSIGKFKYLIFISKRISLQFWPSRPSRPPTCSAFQPSDLWPNPSSGQHAEPSHQPRIPFPLPSPTRAGTHAAASPVRHPLSPTGTMETQQPTLPPLNSTPHQLTAITHPPPLDSGNRRLQANALTPAMKTRRPPPFGPL
jgi:hypothetical protein